MSTPTQRRVRYEAQRRQSLLARVWIAVVLGLLIAAAIYAQQALSALTHSAGGAFG